jgi:predicted adenine nucleotide alpha hydrolase (AANH) superfamily ATPase
MTPLYNIPHTPAKPLNQKSIGAGGQAFQSPRGFASNEGSSNFRKNGNYSNKYQLSKNLNYYQ